MLRRTPPLYKPAFGIFGIIHGKAERSAAFNSERSVEMVSLLLTAASAAQTEERSES